MSIHTYTYKFIFTLKFLSYCFTVSGCVHMNSSICWFCGVAFLVLKFLICFIILISDFIFFEYVSILPVEDLNRTWALKHC